MFSQATPVPFDVVTTSIASIEVTAPYPTGTRGDDLVVVGSDQTDAGPLPTAFSNDNGAFTATNYAVGDFHAWARTFGGHMAQRRLRSQRGGPRRASDPTASVFVGKANH